MVRTAIASPTLNPKMKQDPMKPASFFLPTPQIHLSHEALRRSSSSFSMLNSHFGEPAPRRQPSPVSTSFCTHKSCFKPERSNTRILVDSWVDVYYVSICFNMFQYFVRISRPTRGTNHKSGSGMVKQCQTTLKWSNNADLTPKNLGWSCGWETRFVAPPVAPNR